MLDSMSSNRYVLLFMVMRTKKIIRSAGGVVYRKLRGEYKILLLKKGGRWYLPKGRIERKEKEKDAALREIHEECGIPYERLELEKKIATIRYVVDFRGNLSSPKLVSYFLVQAQQTKVTPLKNEGFSKAVWFGMNNAVRRITHKESKVLMQKAISAIQKKVVRKKISPEQNTSG